MESKSIKESMELLEGIKVLAMDARAVMADGKIDIKDLGVAMGLVAQFGTLNRAVSGVSDVPAELKDLSADEINQLAAKALEIVAAFKAA